MRDYRYRNGEKVQAEDICFYSEDSGSGEYHYGNSICRIVQVGDDLYTEILYWSDNDGMSFNKDGDGNLTSLQFCTGVDDNTLQHFIKIGTEEYHWERRYYNERFGRRGQIKKINNLVKL